MHRITATHVLILLTCMVLLMQIYTASTPPEPCKCTCSCDSRGSSAPHTATPATALPAPPPPSHQRQHSATATANTAPASEHGPNLLLTPVSHGLPSWQNLMVRAQRKLRPNESILGWWMHDTDLADVFPESARGYRSYRTIGNIESEDKTKKHRYDLSYAQLFEPIRGTDTPLRVLEIGLGCRYPSEGASVRTMGRYMPLVNLTMIEFHPKCANGFKRHGHKAPKGGWQFYLADGTKKLTAQRVMRAAKEKFDIILEDASHMMQHQIDSFHAWWPMLKVGGVFVSEDLHTAFLPPSRAYPNTGQNQTAKTGVNFFSYLTAHVHGHPNATTPENWSFTWQHHRFPAEPIASVQCFWSICFVYKNDDRPLDIEAPWKYSGND